MFAMKKVKKSIIREHKLENQFSMEITMQASFNHGNIGKLYGFFDDQNYIYLLLEYMEDGNLFSYLKKYTSLPDKDASQKMC